MEKPLISVILPVYNAESYITDSIRSILSQSYENFELILLNDGSRDQTEEKIKAFRDPRIRYFSHENMGMAATLNRGILLANGAFIARQDGDDISHQDRFAKQLHYLQNHEQTAMVGSWANIVDENGMSTQRVHKHAASNMQLKWDLLFDNPFVHSSILMRKKTLNQLGGYDLNVPALVQDYELWARIAVHYDVANIPECLLDYREVTSGMSQSTQNYHATVAHQSAHYIKTLLPHYPSSVLDDFCYIYHEAYANVKTGYSWRELEGILHVMLNAFSDLYKVSNKQTFEIQGYRDRLKRNFIRYKIHSSSNTASRLFWKIKNKL